jgi:hypothetical protein
MPAEPSAYGSMLWSTEPRTTVCGVEQVLQLQYRVHWVSDDISVRNDAAPLTVQLAGFSCSLSGETLIAEPSLEVVFGDAEDAPADLLPGPGPSPRGGEPQGVDLIPVDTIPGDVLGQLGIGHRRIVASVARERGKSANESGWPILTAPFYCDGADPEGYGRPLARVRRSATELPFDVPQVPFLWNAAAAS